MIQGPPQIPPNPEKMEFKILYPGDEYVFASFNNESKRLIVKPGERVIIAGENTGISLSEMFNNYFFINSIYVNEALRKRGVGYNLCNEATKLAKVEGKKGLLSTKFWRNIGSDGILQHFKNEGRTNTITLNGEKFDVILC